MTDTPPSRIQQLQQAHSWLTTSQCHALIALQYSKFLERYPNTDTTALMDNWTAIATNSDKHWMKDRVAEASEWFLY